MMKIYKKFGKLCILAFFYSMNVHSQDLNFSQFYEMPLLRNPALAGLYKGDFRVTSAFRNQWSSVTTPYVTEALGVEIKLAAPSNDNYIALGLQITNDLAGDSKFGKTQVLPCFTFHKSLNGNEDTYLSLGVIGGVVQQRFDGSKLQFDDQFINGYYSSTNPTRQNFTNTNLIYFDAGVGLLFSNSTGNDVKYYLGASYFHFNSPKVAFDQHQDIRLNKKLMVNAGVSLPASEYDKLVFYGDYFKQGGNRQVQGGVLFNHSILQEYEEDAISFEIGTLLRWNDAVIPVFKWNYYKMGIGFTYDINISKLRPASLSRGGFEATLSYRNFFKNRNSSDEKTRCPAAF